MILIREKYYSNERVTPKHIRHIIIKVVQASGFNVAT